MQFLSFSFAEPRNRGLSVSAINGRYGGLRCLVTGDCPGKNTPDGFQLGHVFGSNLKETALKNEYYLLRVRPRWREALDFKRGQSAECVKEPQPPFLEPVQGSPSERKTCEQQDYG